MKIYTKTGDKGQTSLANGGRVDKFDARIEAYGTSDELNSLVGWLRVSIGEESAQLQWIQNRIFDLGACLAGASSHLEEDTSRQLEIWIDAMQETLLPLNAFIVPSGNEIVCRCHLCRTVTRRLERRMVACEESVGWRNELMFVNRLSDYFFVLARYSAKQAHIGEEKWGK